MPDGDLVAIRMKLTGGKEAAAETKLVRDEMGRLRDEQGRYVKEQVQGQKTTERSTRLTSAAFKKQAALMQSTGRAMTYGMTVPLGLAAAMAVKTAANFDKSMAQVRVATGLGGRGMAEMEALALKWGSETIFSANESAEAMLELTKAGISPAQVKAGALGATMNLAATEGLQLARTAEIVGGAMNTFGIKASESERIADALAGGALASSASVEGLAQSLAQGGQSAAMYGITVEETVGTLAAFAQNGIQASDAGTSLKTFLMRLNPTTKKAKELMSELGLDFFDSHGKMLSLADTSRVLRDRLGDMTDEQRNSALATLFGSDAIRAANIIYSEGPGGINKYVRATEQKGAADKMAQAQMEGLNGALENLKGSLETAAVHLGHALAPAVEVGATAIGGLADGFAALPPGIQTTVAGLGGVVALAGPLLFLAGSAAKAAIAIAELRAAEAAGGGLLGGSRKKMLGRLGVGLVGTTAAQMGGGAIGGQGGELVSNIGTGAATGFAVGGPMGAAVGATAGSVATAVGKISAEMHTLTWEQRRLQGSAKDVANTWREQKVAGRGLVAADERVRTSTRRRRMATQEMKAAQRHYNAVVGEYGAKSRPAIHAEARLTGLVNKHRTAIKRLQNAERLRGVALSAYKTATNVTILAERHRINVLQQLRDRQARLYTAAKRANPQSEKTRELANKLLGTEGKLAGATKKHAQTLSDAASKGGQAYARFLQHANQESLRAGGAMKALNEKAQRLTTTMMGLAELEVNPTLPATPRRPHGHNAAGTNFWRGGSTWLAERGPELVDLPRGSRVHAAPATRRLMGAVPDPQPASAVAAYRGGGGGGRVPLRTTIKIGRRVLAEVLAEAEEDARARL